MEIEKINSMTIINDCYNANLDSMKGAINYLSSLKDTRKVAILGDMLELGEYSEELHTELGKIVKENNIDILITIGENAKNISKSAIDNGMDSDSVYIFDNNKDAIEKIKNIIKPNDTILLKASYGMNFIEIYNELKK